LGERVLCKHEVIGSIPFSSTTASGRLGWWLILVDRPAWSALHGLPRMVPDEIPFRWQLAWPLVWLRAVGVFGHGEYVVMKILAGCGLVLDAVRRVPS
jgi:hypothetical protein